MGDFVDWVDCASAARFHAIPPVAKRTANAQSSGERKNCSSRAAIFYGYDSRPRTRFDKKSLLSHEYRAWERLGCLSRCASVKHVHWVACFR